MKSKNDPMHTANPPTDRLHRTPRCGARTRQGTPCKGPAVKGKARCRMHGGAAGSGGKIGNQNALKHGHWSAEEMAFRKLVGEVIKKGRELAGSN